MVFGSGLDLFTNRLLFLDALHYNSNGLFGSDLVRNVQIDIDDIFVGAPGTRMGASDVDAMVDFTQKWNKTIENFHFIIGFSGKFIYRGNDTENAGDKHFLEQKGKTR